MNKGKRNTVKMEKKNILVLGEVDVTEIVREDCDLNFPEDGQYLPILALYTEMQIPIFLLVYYLNLFIVKSNSSNILFFRTENYLLQFALLWKMGDVMSGIIFSLAGVEGQYPSV